MASDEVSAVREIAALVQQIENADLARAVLDATQNVRASEGERLSRFDSRATVLLVSGSIVAVLLASAARSLFGAAQYTALLGMACGVVSASFSLDALFVRKLQSGLTVETLFNKATLEGTAPATLPRYLGIQATAQWLASEAVRLVADQKARCVLRAQMAFAALLVCMLATTALASLASA